MSLSRTRSLPLLLLVALVAVALPASGGWRAEGPGLANVTDLALDPQHPETVYVATENGGIWRSDDSGATWLLPGDEMTSRDVSWVMADPGSSATLWASVEAEDGARLWRSRDRGATWETVDGPLVGSQDTIATTGRRIAFAPSQPRTLYLPATNLHYRSSDGGKSWTDFRVPGQDVYVFAFDPEDPRVIYAGGRGEERQLSRSDDGGKSWQALGEGLPEESLHLLVVDPTDRSRIYAMSSTNTLSVSVDRGATWSRLATPGGATDDTYSLILDPKDARVLWLANGTGLFRSGDGGKSWNRHDSGTGRYVCKAVAIDPRDSRRMITGTSGTGVYRSRDGGVSWTPSTEGIVAAWIEALYVPPTGGALFAQTSNGLFRRSAGGAWREVLQPFSDEDAVELAGMLFDRRTPRTVFAYASSSLWRSEDGGDTWQAEQRPAPRLRDQLRGQTDSVEFAALAQDPAEPRTFYAGSWSSSDESGAVFKSTDGGGSWKKAGKGIEGQRVKRLFAPSANVVLAIVDDNRLYRTVDAGAHWSLSDLGLPDQELRGLAADPTRPGRFYLASADGLFRSDDGGASWERCSDGLADEDVEAVVVSAAGEVYAGTFQGVSRSADGGATWIDMRNGLPNTDVRALAIGGEPLRLWAGMAGGGVWSLELP